MRAGRGALILIADGAILAAAWLLLDGDALGIAAVGAVGAAVSGAAWNRFKRDRPLERAPR
jgi:membrane associated rhomboid family serine protease